jgi:hypothetical protein
LLDGSNESTYSLSDISWSLGFNKNLVFGFVTTLCTHGYLQKEAGKQGPKARKPKMCHPPPHCVAHFPKPQPAPQISRTFPSGRAPSTPRLSMPNDTDGGCILT